MCRQRNEPFAPVSPACQDRARGLNSCSASFWKIYWSLTSAIYIVEVQGRLSEPICLLYIANWQETFPPFNLKTARLCQKVYLRVMSAKFLIIASTHSLCVIMYSMDSWNFLNCIKLVYSSVTRSSLFIVCFLIAPDFIKFSICIFLNLSSPFSKKNIDISYYKLWRFMSVCIYLFIYLRYGCN